MGGVLERLMDAGDVDVRIGASEALAVLVEQCRAADEGFDANAGDALDGLIEQLGLLSTDSDRRRAKKERSKQRAEVRGVLRFVEGGDAPSETFKVAGQVVEIAGYGEAVQLEAFRDALATGLQTQLLVCVPGDTWLSARRCWCSMTLE
jgi:hypothetical protein